MLIRKGDLIARIKNIFGNVIDEYVAPCSGLVGVVILRVACLLFMSTN